MATSILAIITAILPMAIKLITAFLSKSDAKQETKKKWLEFMNSLEESADAPSRLRKSYTKQISEVDAMIKEIEAKEGVKK